MVVSTDCFSPYDFPVVQQKECCSAAACFPADAMGITKMQGIRVKGKSTRLGNPNAKY